MCPGPIPLDFLHAPPPYPLLTASCPSSLSIIHNFMSPPILHCSSLTTFIYRFLACYPVPARRCVWTTGCPRITLLTGTLLVRLMVQAGSLTMPSSSLIAQSAPTGSEQETRGTAQMDAPAPGQPTHRCYLISEWDSFCNARYNPSFKSHEHFKWSKLQFTLRCEWEGYQGKHTMSPPCHLAHLFKMHSHSRRRNQTSNSIVKALFFKRGRR